MKFNIHIESDEEDKEKKSDRISVEQQIESQLKSGKLKNPLRELTGKWPGDESFEDLLAMLAKE